MDGRGAWRDNVFVERLWRSVKYEEVYLRAYDSVSEARASLGRYLDFYNSQRPHSSLGARTPEQAYLDHLLTVRGSGLGSRVCRQRCSTQLPGSVAIRVGSATSPARPSRMAETISGANNVSRSRLPR